VNTCYVNTSECNDSSNESQQLDVDNKAWTHTQHSGPHTTTMWHRQLSTLQTSEKQR